MRLYTAAFHACTSHYGNNSSKLRILSKVAQLDLLMWRAFLCLLLHDERTYAGSLESFRINKPTFLIEYDASLTGLGIIISQLDSVINGESFFIVD